MKSRISRKSEKGIGQEISSPILMRAWGSASSTLLNIYVLALSGVSLPFWCRFFSSTISLTVKWAQHWSARCRLWVLQVAHPGLSSVVRTWSKKVFMGHLLRSGVEGSLLPPSLWQRTSSSVLLGNWKSCGLPPPEEGMTTWHTYWEDEIAFAHLARWVVHIRCYAFTSMRLNFSCYYLKLLEAVA